MNQDVEHKPLSEAELKEQGVKDPGRRRFLGFARDAAKAVAAVGLAAATGLAISPKGEGDAKTSPRELKEGDPIDFIELARGSENGFQDEIGPKPITTEDEFNTIVEQIKTNDPDFSRNQSNSLLVKGFRFDPDKYVAVLYALGEQHNPIYNVAITGANYEGRQIVVKSERHLPFVSAGLSSDEGEKEESSKTYRPFHFVLFNNVKTTDGKTIDFRLADPAPIPKTSPLIRMQAVQGPKAS